MNKHISSIIDNLDYCLFSEKKSALDQSKIQSPINELNIFDFMEQSAKAEGLADVFHLCTILQSYYGFACFGVGLMLPRLTGKPVFNHLHSDCEWETHYVSNNLLRIDPFVRHCVEKINPLYWDRSNNSVLLNDSEKRVIRDAQDFGISNIITVPWHGPNSELGGMKVTSVERSGIKEPDIRFVLPVIVTASHSIHEAFYRVMSKSLKNKEITLSPREREILLWAATGNDSWKIGQILNISENTVNTHLKNAYKKLNVRSRQHAVAKAICLKLIHI